jgi:hypothetical protein
VPAHGEGQLSQWLRKAKWVLLAILAPELGVYTALEQYMQAKGLARELDKISRDARERVSKNTARLANQSSKLDDVSQSVDSHIKDSV